MELKVEGLTQKRFAPFGDVIEPSRETATVINDGHTIRYDALATVDPGKRGKAVISVFQGRLWWNDADEQFKIRMLERHPLASQAFIPLSRAPWLVVVADRPEAKAVRCFKARGTQGVQYAPGVWHHPLLVLRPVHEFLVVDRAGPGENLEEATIKRPPHIALPVAPRAAG